MKVWCQQEHLVTSVIWCKFKKISLKSDFIQFLHNFIHDYSPRVGADRPQGQSFDVNRNVLSLQSFVASLKKCLWSLILYNVFHNLIHVYSPGARTAHRGQNFDVNRKALSLYPFVASFIEISLKSDFIQFFHDLKHVYSPGAGGIQPPGV